MSTVLHIDDVWKDYRLGVISHGTLFRDIQSWWARWRGKEDPNTPIQFHESRRQVGGKIWALREISLKARQGEVIGLIGKNGAGKSTLLKILSRVTAPTRGEVKLKGQVGSLLEVGTGFHPELTGRENIFLNGAILGMTIHEIRGKFEEIVDFAGLEKFIDTPVKRYSSGMYVRLAFAVAAHLNAEILAVDEVLAVGDAEFQKKCLAKMGEVTGEGRTVLFVSHNMESITSLCDRVILLDGGRLIKDGEAAAVVAAYAASMASFRRTANGYVSLADHPGRNKGWMDGLVRMSHCFLTDAQGQRVDYFSSGKTGNITIGFEKKEAVQQTSVTFVIIIENDKGQRVSYLSSEVVGARLTDLPARGEVRCAIPRLPLVPGNYTLSLICRVGPLWSDSVYHAVSFDVVGADFYPTGQLPPADVAGNVLMDYEWFGPQA